MTVARNHRNAHGPDVPDAAGPEPRQRLTDVLVAAVAATASVAVAGSPPEAGARAPGAVGFGLLVVAAGLLLVRRRRPVPVLLAVFGVTYAYLVLDFPGGAELPLLAVAVYTAAAAGRRWWVTGVVAVAVLGALSHRLLVDQESVAVVVISTLPLVLVALLGDGVFARRRLRAEIRERLRMLETEKELEAEARLTAERLRIAHELHDVLAHTITTMTVQAGAVADGLDRDSDARATLMSLRTSARDAMQQLRATIAVLRAGDGELDRLPAPGLDRLPGLVRSLAESGVDVEVDVEGPRHDLPAAVDLTAYRIIQEALTNVLRHAGTDHARVDIRHGPSSVSVTVEDEGAGITPADGTRGGFGLVGMRERAHAVGGRLHAGPRDGGGFRVEAVLPAGQAAP